jgi:hypothetical protein
VQLKLVLVRKPYPKEFCNLKSILSSCSIGSPEAHPSGCKSATIVKNIVFKAQGRAVKSRWHLAPSSLPIRQVCGLLPVLIDSIRLLPHDLWLSLIFFHLWVIVDLLYPVTRVCSNSIYLRFVEICRWNYWTASHTLCLWILLLQAWVIVDLLFPITRDCSKSTYLRFVEIKGWNYYISYPCSLAFHIFVAYLGDYGLGVIVHVPHWT